MGRLKARSPPRSHWDLRAARNPIVIAAEFETEFVVVNPQIAVAAARHGIRHHCLHLLRDHANIGLVAAEITEPIVAETVPEITKQHNVVLQREIGAPAATAAATSSTTKATASSTTKATASSTAEATAGRGEARAATRRRSARRPAR